MLWLRGIEIRNGYVRVHWQRYHTVVSKEMSVEIAVKFWRLECGVVHALNGFSLCISYAVTGRRPVSISLNGLRYVKRALYLGLYTCYPGLYTRTFIPATRTFIPATRAFIPATRTFIPTTRTFIPATRTFIPATRTFIPATRTFIPATRTFIPRTQTFIPATRAFIPGTRTFIPGTRTHACQHLKISLG